MLVIQNLTVVAKEKELLHKINMEVKKGTAIGLTGRSGAGKTTILRSIMGILGTSCRITEGDILLNGKGIGRMSPERRRQLNGKIFGLIPQNPMTAFDPRLKIKKQLLELFDVRMGLSGDCAKKRMQEAFARLNLWDAERIMESYPSELSGGMLQRIAASVLLIMQPDYIIADEPTSALDEDNREILLNLLEDQKRSSGILLVSHDIEALTDLCDDLYVLEHGNLIEKGPVGDVLQSPAQGWTKEFVQAYRRSENEVWQWKAL